MDAPMVEMDEITAEEAFTILGNQTRMGILRELWRRDGPCSFGELQQTVAPDDRGNFSYHLGKLTDHFVRKTDEGYSLRFSGEQVVRAVLTGTITTDPTIPPTTATEQCLFCGERVRMRYEEEVLSAQCHNCGGIVGGEFSEGTTIHFEFPPAGLAERDYDEIMYAAHVLYDSKISPMIKGICPECAGQVATTIDICESHEPEDSGLCSNCDRRYELWGTFRCENCLYRRAFPVWYAALNHPGVTAFFYEHGLEEKVPFRKITWDNERFMRDITGTVVETEPCRFRIIIPIEDERLLVTVDESLDVVDIEREHVDQTSNLS